ncbi:MAG: acetate kinase [Lentisphaeria bacterium]|jgi:acetate kinase
MKERTILVINGGSSSVKFPLFNQSHCEIASGLAERLGAPGAQLTINAEGKKQTYSFPDAKHAIVVNSLIDTLIEMKLLDDGLGGIGHRVVHGGEYFAESVAITAEVIDKIASCNHLASRQNPANVLGIQILQQRFPHLPQVAVFDTAFHQTIVKHAYIYGLPYAYYRDLGLWRYGFHGTSHCYDAEQAIERLQLNRNDNAVISAHLGNGCNVAAVRNGRSVDTSMGLTPLEGLLMGTRCGDVDPSVHHFLVQQLNIDLTEVTHILNTKVACWVLRASAMICAHSVRPRPRATSERRWR